MLTSFSVTVVPLRADREIIKSHCAVPSHHNASGYVRLGSYSEVRARRRCVRFAPRTGYLRKPGKCRCTRPSAQRLFYGDVTDLRRFRRMACMK